MAIDMLSTTIGATAAFAAQVGLGRLREHRTTAAGVADLLNWAFLIDEGTVLQKDGSLLAGWSYRGPDVTAASPAALRQLSRSLNDAFLPLTDSWMLHVDAVRRPATTYSATPFPNAVTALIDAERRAAYTSQGAHFETEYYLTVTHLPPPEMFTKLGQWFLQTGGSRGHARGIDWPQVLSVFNTAIHAFEQRLSSVLTLQRLGSEALLTHLHRALTGLAHPVNVPSHGSYLNAVLSDQELTGGFEPRIGNQHVRVVAIQGFPQSTHAGALDVLTTLPFSYRWSTRLLPLGQRTAAKLIRRHQLRWFQKRKGAGAWLREMTTSQAHAMARGTQGTDDAFLDHDAIRMVRDAGDAFAENTSGAVRFCFTTQGIVVMESDAPRADAVAREIVKTLHDAGFGARIETVNAFEAYLGSLPGHGRPNVRRPLLSTANVTDLLPMTSVWPGLAENPSPYFPAHSPPLLWAKTEGSTPFRLNLHEGDLGHTLIVGRSGAGKSTLVGLLTAQFQRYPDAQVFVFDVGYSGWTLAKAAGVPHYDVAAGSVDTLAFQPLAAIDLPGERVWAAEWLETVFALQGVTMTPPLRARVETALELVACNAREHRTLTELTVHLQQPELVAALRPYTVGGLYGQLLDATSDDLSFTPSDARYQVFELKHLMEMDDKILVPTALYLFHRMEQRFDGRPTLLVFEELWAALMRSAFATRVKQWLLTLRKQNVAVVLVAHSVGQLAQIPDRHALLESCATRIFLPNPDATARETAALYEDLGLTPHEVAIIAGATPKRHYYYASPQGRRLFELGLGPVALSFLATPHGLTADGARREITSLINRHGIHWPSHWLRRVGLSPWADQYEVLARPVTPPFTL